jgi:uncharacterized protein (TIGR03085 family)
MPSHSAAERAALADALTSAGPHRPTLCDGWTTTELAAHLVARERRPDSALAALVPALSGWSGRVQAKYARRPYAELVRAIRTGPPRTSPMAIPGADARINLVEHFVHCEDVRRAGPGWTPRDLPAARQDALWATLLVIGRLNFRKSPVSVTLRTPDGRSKQVITRAGAEGIELVGEPAELTLYSSGRKDQAQVQLEGPDDAVTAFRALSLNV